MSIFHPVLRGTLEMLISSGIEALSDWTCGAW